MPKYTVTSRSVTGGLLTTVPIGKSPDVANYKQTSKSVSGIASWYTTETDMAEGALRTAVNSAAGATVKQHREASFSIINELRVYNPTRVIISEIYVASKWSGSGVELDSDVDLFLKNIYGDVLIEFKNINSGFEKYQDNSIFPNLDVTGQQQFAIDVFHDVYVGAGGNDVRTRSMTVKFLFETDTAIYPILVRIQDDHGYLLADSHARIDGTTYDFLGGEETIQLPTGDYKIEAWAYIGKTQYVGSGSFNVPQNAEITITLHEKFAFELPWWWWIPVAGIGGLATIWLIRKIVFKEEKPPIFVVK